MSTLPICLACGMQYAAPRSDCPVCEDQRQYVPLAGQQWTDLDTLRAGHTSVVRGQGPGIIGIGCEPKFAIGQRALLVQAASGNFLWDCTAFLDDALIDAVDELGGLTGIAISHPHYYTTVVEWAHAFDVPVYLHENDREWLGRPDPAIEWWSGQSKHVADDLELINLGVHFAGGTVLHWPDGENGAGALLSGDIVQVIPDRTHVGFMYSYPNLIPLNAQAVRGIVAAVEPYSFDRLYPAWSGKIVAKDAKAAVQRSADRYIEHIRD
jgi:hypothetical protein